MYHGTSEEVISSGIGHMYGTSRPSTRAVLTAHSGLPRAELFTPLHNAEVGQTFWISVLGEDHHYRVESIETVEPGETESLEIIEGEDWVTLFTCTPVGVNSHRLLVHAIRIDAPESSGGQTIGGDGIRAGFPWWAVWFVGGSGIIPRRFSCRCAASHLNPDSPQATNGDGPSGRLDQSSGYRLQ